MSADNWKMCPKCNEKALQEIAEMETLAKEKYGKISLTEYEKLKMDLNEKRSTITNDSGNETLREDYETYSDGYNLHINYGCSCEVCGFTFTFEWHVLMN